jgi:hypothetical protein
MRQKPKRLNVPQPCRYCGFLSDGHRHERGLYGVPNYECRDVSGCGDRIRANKVAKGERVDSSDLPF